MKRKITFNRDGLTLVGNLFTPDDFDQNSRYPAVVVQGSYSSVKEQMPETYAQKLAAAGFVVLAFDYAHYGESAGEPRQLESPTEKVADVQAAVTHLLGLPYVDAVGMLGICTSAGVAAYVGAADPRVQALATVAAALNDPELAKDQMGEDTFAQRIAASAESRRKYEQTGELDLVTTYSETDPTAVVYIPFEGAFDYYTNPARGAVPTYRNESAVMGVEAYLISQAPAITAPFMVVHSDDSAAPEVAKRFYEGLAGEKELVWGNGNHYDYYDSEAQIDFAVANVSRFFRTHLAA
jgi:dienelactone hydrolase